MAATHTITLSSLLSAVSYAAWREREHQKRCRNRERGEQCKACMRYEADWLKADDELLAFRARVLAENTASVRAYVEECKQMSEVG